MARPTTKISELRLQIWIINPFDQLPNETDVPLRYWALCRTFAEQGHEVIWWSSDFSHLTKSKRKPCPDTDGFSVRLIETPLYAKNISFARLKNHKAFADGFYRDAMAGLKSDELSPPDRIVVSLPPLGVAEAAFRIRDEVNRSAQLQQACHATTPTIQHSERSLKRHATATSPSEVVVDIMDAWPETFYQALPRALRKTLGSILLAPMHRSAKRAYQGADKISAVGQSYLNLAQKYLEQRGSDTPVASGNTKQATGVSLLQKPTHLCYHGTDLERFAQKTAIGGQRTDVRKQKTGFETDKSLPNKQQTTSASHKPLKAVYLGAMGSGYDLQTIIDVAGRWKEKGQFPFQIHFAGDGPQREALEARCEAFALTARVQKAENRGQSPEDERQHEKSDKSVASTSAINDSERIVFHGQLGRDAVNELLLASDIALVPNRPDSLVACPYKAGEYAAARLPIISCLRGELDELLNHWGAGSEYNEGDAASLHAAFKKYSTDPQLLNQQSINARSMAEALFDRTQTYDNLCDFILQ